YLKSKVEELTTVNNDTFNFVHSSQAATIFLDGRFRIKRFTPSATNNMSLIASNIGRPLDHMTHRFADENLVADDTQVLRNLAALRKEVRASAAPWFTMTCVPYRTVANKMDGVFF